MEECVLPPTLQQLFIWFLRHAILIVITSTLHLCPHLTFLVHTESCASVHVLFRSSIRNIIGGCQPVKTIATATVNDVIGRVTGTRNRFHHRSHHANTISRAMDGSMGLYDRVHRSHYRFAAHSSRRSMLRWTCNDLCALASGHMAERTNLVTDIGRLGATAERLVQFTIYLSTYEGG